MKQWYRTAPAKFILWVLSIVFAFTAMVGGSTIYDMYTGGMFTESYSQLMQTSRSRAVRSIAYEIAGNALYDEDVAAYSRHTLNENEMVYAQLLDLGRSNEVIWKEGDATKMSTEGFPTFSYTLSWESIYAWDDTLQAYNDQVVHKGPYQITVVYAREDVPVLTDATKSLELYYNNRELILYGTVGAAVLALICFALLVWGVGRRKGSPEAYKGFFTGIPFDIFTVGVIAAYILAGTAVHDTVNSPSLDQVLRVLLLLIIASVWVVDVVIRHKMGGVWRTTLIARVWHVLAVSVEGLPLVPYVALVLVVICLMEAVAMAFFLPGISFFYVLFWLVEKAVLVPAVLYLAVGFHQLQVAAADMADGHLDRPVDTSRLAGPLKLHGENLAAIAASTDVAVQQRLKSELFKTTLITNVSHDIKTPLTSIISYTDLICQEKTDNPNIADYAQVLHRQAERLKKLLEDLMQASKVATGNLDSHPAPCQIGVLLEQAGGEYEQKLAENELELVLQKPDHPVTVMADGQHLWRIFDNLMNNICKYAQPHTRVYLSLEDVEQQAVITFRNISRNALNVNPEQLLERFSRGDSSRTTEGSGLGLSIAQSLTEMQGGKMNLVCDGDLFKIILTFPTIPAPQAEPETEVPAAENA